MSYEEAENMTSKPFDSLEDARGKRILIKLKGGHEINGILKSFDHHLNIWLEDADENSSEAKRKLGNVLVRGDNILIVSPA